MQSTKIVESLGPRKPGGQLPQLVQLAHMISRAIHLEMLGGFDDVLSQLRRLREAVNRYIEAVEDQDPGTWLGKGPAATWQVSLDADHLSVKIGERWVSLHNKPLLFTFVKTLAEENALISKRQLAESLWPTQTYLPRTHDARLFDIAKRVKQIFAEQGGGQVVLLGSRHGYRLAVKEKHAERNL